MNVPAVALKLGWRGGEGVLTALTTSTGSRSWGSIPIPSGRSFLRRQARPSFGTSTWIFVRLLGLVYLFAFGSLALQIQGLVGHDGILPAGQFISAIAQWQDAEGLGPSRFWRWPTIFWLSTSDQFLEGVSLAGALMAALVAFGVAPTLFLPFLWAAYLSLAVVCGDFLSYQWDALMLESGLLAIPLAPLARWHRASDAIDPPPIARWLIWWLLFRFTFGSGVVKLTSGDPTWRSLHALTVHYETQPLPTPFAWYVSRLPAGFHEATTAAVLAIELLVPWLIFGPRRARHVACAILVAVQAAIALTGNYTFFNLLTVSLCVLLLDDEAFGRIADRFRRQTDENGGSRAKAATVRAPRHARVLASLLALVTFPVSVVAFTGQLGLAPPGSELVRPLWVFVEPARSVNTYGLFAMMTTTRPEIVVEGSNDGITWLAYEFKYKPGDPRRAPGWVAPHQPRLDWQMWFAALSRYEEEPWYQNFFIRLLEGSPSVMKLLAHDPFEGKPPRFVRGVLYRYRFADAAARRTSGVWWTREELGLYSPPVSLRSRE